MKAEQKKRIRKLLAKHNLRITESRMAVLEKFFNKKVAMSHATLEDELKDHDRVTLYRTLNTFLEQGLLHRVIDDAGILIYALCEEDCTPEEHQDAHIHFKCYECGETECLTGLDVPEVKLPEGYISEEKNMLINGLCKKCHLE